MGKYGKVDFKNLEKFVHKVESKLSDKELELFMKSCAKKVASMVLRGTIEKTPVKTGVLRRGWTVGNVEKQGNQYVIEVYNDIEYAPYVEHGHRTKNHKGWVEGRHMLKLTVDEVQDIAPKILENQLVKKLKEVFESDHS